MSRDARMARYGAAAGAVLIGVLVAAALTDGLGNTLATLLIGGGLLAFLVLLGRDLGMLDGGDPRRRPPPDPRGGADLPGDPHPGNGSDPRVGDRAGNGSDPRVGDRPGNGSDPRVGERPGPRAPASANGHAGADAPAGRPAHGRRPR